MGTPASCRRVVERNELDVATTGDPTGLIGTGGDLVVVEARDLPDSPLLHVLVLADALLPARAAAQLSDHREFAPAAFGGLAVGREIQDRRVFEHGVQATGWQTLAAVAPCREEIPADRSAALEAVGTIDGLGVAGEEQRHLAPQAELRIVRVGDLQALDGADILGTLDLQRESGKVSRLVDRAHSASGIRDRDGDQDERESCSHTRVAQHNAGDPHPEGRKQ